MTLRLGIALLALSCTPIDKAAQSIKRGEDAVKALVAHEGIRAITLNDWATVFFVPPEKVSAYLACHEQRHQEQASWYDSGAEFRLEYLQILAANALKAEADGGRYVGLAAKLLDGPTMDELNALGEELKAMLRDAYKVHPMEVDAREHCAHLED